MNLLAGGISPENELTVIILCVSAVVLVLFDVVLLVSLHRRNRKLAKKRAEAEGGEAAPVVKTAAPAAEAVSPAVETVAPAAEAVSPVVAPAAPAAETSTPAAGRGSEQQNHNM